MSSIEAVDEATLSSATLSRDTLPREAVPLSEYLSPLGWWLYVTIMVVGIALRWALLDMRPLHHDESLHVMYGFYPFDHPEFNFYRYNPMLHGPFLYNLWPLVYNTFGVSIWSARAPIPLIGTVMLFLPLLFRRYVSGWAMLGITAALALSPSVTYWFRFLREDATVALAWMIIAAGVLWVPSRWKAFLVMLGITLHYCMKENSYVHTAIILGYLVFEVFVALTIYKQGPKIASWSAIPALQPSHWAFPTTLLGRILHHVRSQWKVLIAGALVCFYVYAYFFTSGFRYAGNFGDGGLKGWFEYLFGPLLDGLYRESIKYWLEHHGMERIKGPFLFHVYVMSFYDSFLVLGFFWVLWRIFWKGASWVRTCFVLLTLLCVLSAIFGRPEGAWSTGSFWTAVWEFFKLKDWRDLVGLFFLLGISPLVTVYHLSRNERALAFWGYLFTSLLFSYSYLGEKVPWLSLYPILTGLVYLVLFLEQEYLEGYFRPWSEARVRQALIVLGIICLVLGVIFTAENKLYEGAWNLRSNRGWLGTGAFLTVAGVVLKAQGYDRRFHLGWWLFAAVAIYTFRANILTNYVYAGSANEYMSQVHTTDELHSIALRIRHEIDTSAKGYKPLVLAEGEPVWPLTTYFVQLPNEYRFTSNKDEWPTYDYIFQDFKEPTPEFPAEFHVQKITLRGWWVPEFGQVTLKKFLHYAVNHRPWNPEGYSYAYLLTNRGIPRGR